MQLVFDIFDYLLNEEVVNSLRIAEVFFNNLLKFKIEQTNLKNEKLQNNFKKFKIFK